MARTLITPDQRETPNNRLVKCVLAMKGALMDCDHLPHVYPDGHCSQCHRHRGRHCQCGPDLFPPCQAGEPLVCRNCWEVIS
jgi:hypothetical protein